jgi:hypothetical protein
MAKQTVQACDTHIIKPFDFISKSFSSNSRFLRYRDITCTGCRNNNQTVWRGLRFPLANTYT